MKKAILIIKLTGVFFKWCIQGIKESFEDIKLRYRLETGEEGKEIDDIFESLSFDEQEDLKNNLKEIFNPDKLSKEEMAEINKSFEEINDMRTKTGI